VSPKLRAHGALGGAASSPAESSSEVSFERIYDQWFDHVSRWVGALGASDADREDLVQDVFIVAHRRLASFDGGNLAGWLYQIARRKVRDYRSLAWVKHFFAASRPPLVDSTLQTLASPLDQLETREKAALLEELLGTLNLEQRAAFVLFEIEGLSGEHIAELQAVPINTVWARIYKARRKLVDAVERLEREALKAQKRPAARSVHRP
jgi:RNA polymerase sigma-70 factor, ECF subfamily